MIGPNAFDTVDFHGNFLSRAQLGDENVWICGLNNVVSIKEFLLSSDRVVVKVARINMGVMVKFRRVIFFRFRVGILGAFHVESQYDGVIV